MRAVLFIALFFSVSLMAAEPRTNVYPIGIAVHSAGTKLVFSNGCVSDNASITIEKHMIKEAYVWKYDPKNGIMHESTRLNDFQAMNKVGSNKNKDEVVVLFFYSPEEMYNRIWKEKSFA